MFRALLQATKGLEKNRGWFSHLWVNLSFRGSSVLLLLEHLISESLTCLLFLRLLWPGAVCLNFSDPPVPPSEGSTFQVSSVSQTEPIGRPRDTDQPGFPSPFPEIAARHTALILKTHFWKVGPKLCQVVLGLNHSCLSKQPYFCLATLMGITASQKLEPKSMCKLISHLQKNEGC